MSHGAIRTLPLFRMRFTFPESPVVYAYTRAASLARSLAGSAANHTGVFTPWPLFLKVSRFKYLCPANAAKLLASLRPRESFATTLRCPSFYTRHKQKEGRTISSVPSIHFSRCLLDRPVPAAVRYIGGKFASAFTSRICAVCLRVWPEIRRIH